MYWFICSPRKIQSLSRRKTSFRSWLPSSYVVLKIKHYNNALLVNTLNRMINKNCLITNLMMGMTKEKHVLTFFMCIRISGKISPLTQNALNFICKLTRFFECASPWNEIPWIIKMLRVWLGFRNCQIMYKSFSYYSFKL